MLRDDAITLILNRTGQRGGAAGPVDTVLQAQAITEMQFVQEELERGGKGELPWFLETEYEDAAFKTAVATKTAAMPPSTLRELDDEPVTLFLLDPTTNEWAPLEKVDYNEGMVNVGETAGQPTAYTVFGTQYRFWGTPDAEYSLRALVYVADAVLSTNIQNKWLEHAGQVIIGRTGEQVAQLVRDEQARAYFAAMTAAGLIALSRANVAWREAGRMRSVGEE